ncbi:MAG: alpha/beta family hydrolase [Pseudomonadota bacterium]
MSVAAKLLVNEPATAARASFIFAHGAGAAMDTAFMNFIAEGLAAQYSIRCVRFEFPYMAARRVTGKRRAPDRPEVLKNAFLECLPRKEDTCVFIGGKSMGGRIASLLASEVRPAGVICLGFPLHSAGKPVNGERLECLKSISVPTCICQGTRDTMGNQGEIESIAWPELIQWHWLEDGDHSFKPRKASGHTIEDHLQTALEKTGEFIIKHSST